MAREPNKKNTGLLSLGSLTRKTRWLIPVNNDKTVNVLAGIFGDRESRVFREKGEWDTGIKYCVQPP